MTARAKTALLQRAALCGLVTLAFALILASTVSSDPPQPFNVKGFVFNVGGTGAPNGIPILINDSTANTTAITQVFAPPIPQLAGAYSATINGSTNDKIVVWAWNATNFGNATKTLSSTTEVNVTLNMTRSAEPNVTIVAPPDNTTEELGRQFNVTVNVTVLVADGNCSVTLSFGNASVLAFGSGETQTHNLGNISQGTTLNTTFNVTTLAVGVSSVRANASCAPGPIFLARNVDTLSNITVKDTTGPTIVLLSPNNNTLNRTNNTVVFFYNVTDFSAIANCTLSINGVANLFNGSVTRGIAQQFNTTLQNGQHNWSIACFDVFGNLGNSAQFTLTISVNSPNVTAANMEPIIVLNAGSTRTVLCNVSVTDLDGAPDIVGVNATFYAQSNKSGDPDNPNGHYTNSSCAVASSFGNQKNFTCSFWPWSFAVNGTWWCNATATDAENLVGIGKGNTSIDPLYALNVTDTYMDFGNVPTGAVSGNITQNISNIGNQPINVTTYAFGLVPGDGHAFSCSTSNIPANNLRFALNSTADYPQKTPLSGSLKQVGLTIRRQTVVDAASQNTTWWQLFVPLNVSDIGSCVGSVVFQAEKS